VRNLGSTMGIHGIRQLIYWLGFRPNRPSIFFSPTLDLFYGVKEAKPFEGLEQGIAERHQFWEDDQS